MVWLLVPYLIAAEGPDYSQQMIEVSQDSGDEVDDCKDNVKMLKNRMLGLQFFLEDKKEYKENCPKAKWKQPTLEEYRKKPRSYLPKECKTSKK